MHLSGYYGPLCLCVFPHRSTLFYHGRPSNSPCFQHQCLVNRNITMKTGLKPATWRRTTDKLLPVVLNVMLKKPFNVEYLQNRYTAEGNILFKHLISCPLLLRYGWHLQAIGKVNAAKAIQIGFKMPGHFDCFLVQMEHQPWAQQALQYYLNSVFLNGKWVSNSKKHMKVVFQTRELLTI